MNREVVTGFLALMLCGVLVTFGMVAYDVLDRLAFVEARAEICMDVLRLEGPL